MQRQELDIIMLFPKVVHLCMRKLIHGFKPVQAQLPLNDTQQRTLMVLYHKGPMTMTQLHQAMALEKGSLTSVVDRLIAIGFAERKNVVGDRRKIKIELTPTGREKTARLNIELAEFIRNRLTKLTTGDRERFYQAVEVLNEISRKL